MSTDTGEIIGFLRLNGDDWMRTVAQCEAAAQGLGKTDPNVRISTNADKVTAQLAATEAAARRLDRSQMQAHRSSGLLLTAIVGLAPALVPIGAAATGVGLSMAGMGAAGILAIVAIKKEMEEGTALGQAYQVGIDKAKDSTQALGRAAAGGVLRPFLRVISELETRTPALTTQMGVLGAQLGGTLSGYLVGAMSLFQRFNPLLEAAGNYGVLAGHAFSQWAANTDFSGFMSYVISTLPQVLALMQELVPAVGNILVAFAPMGSTVVTVLRVLSSAINALPTPVLQTLATTGIAVFMAFKTWSTISAVVVAVSAALDRLAVSSGRTTAALTALKGAAGWIGLIVGVATLAWTAHEQSVQANRAAVEALTQALVTSGGAIDQNVRQTMAKQLADQGLLADARILGIDLGLVTSAMLNQGDAAEVLMHRLEGMQGSISGEKAKAWNNLGQALATNADNMSAAALQADAMRQAQDAAAGSATAQGSALALQAAQLGSTTVALQAAKDQQDKHTAAAAAATVQMQLENNAAGLLKAALDQLSGKALTAAQTQNAFDQAQIAVNNSLTNGSAAFGDHSAAAVQNEGALLQAVAAAQSAAAAYGNEAQSTEAGRQKALQMKDAIIENAVAHGVSRDAVAAFIDKVFQIPASVPPTRVDADTSAAEAKLATLTRPRWVTVNVSVNGGRSIAGGLTIDAADGGIFGPLGGGTIVRSFAHGGGFSGSVGSGQPSIRSAGGRGIRWAEEGAGGWEGFISGHPAKRLRSMSVAEEVVSRLGGAVRWTPKQSDAGPVAVAQPGVSVEDLRAALQGLEIRLTGKRALAGEMAAEIHTAIARGL